MPSEKSEMETSRALVDAVPDQEVTWISFMRPVLKDLRLSVGVAPVSTRNRISAGPIRTLTIGSRSHRRWEFRQKLLRSALTKSAQPYKIREQTPPLRF